MFEDRRGHTESLAPDVGEPWDPPVCGGVEPVVGPGREVDHHLVQLPSPPHHSGTLGHGLPQEGVETVVGPLHLLELQPGSAARLGATEGHSALINYCLSERDWDVGPSHLTISGTHHPRPPLQHSQARLKSPPRPESITSPSLPLSGIVNFTPDSKLNGFKKDWASHPHSYGWTRRFIMFGGEGSGGTGGTGGRERIFPEESSQRLILEYLTGLRLPDITSEDQTVDWQQQSSSSSVPAELSCPTDTFLLLTVLPFCFSLQFNEKIICKVSNWKWEKLNLLFNFWTGGDCCDCCLILLRLPEAEAESVQQISQIILKIPPKADCGRARREEISGLQEAWCLDKDLTALCSSRRGSPSSWARWHC